MNFLTFTGLQPTELSPMAGSLSLGMILLIIFVVLGIGKILTGITIWRFLKLKDKKKGDDL